MSPGDTIVLKMDNIAVSDTEGLALLKIREVSSGGDGSPNPAKPPVGKFYSVTHALVKSAPKGPRNFRPDKSMVDGDAREDVVLRWDGPNDLTYWIQSPDGQKVRVSQAASGLGVTQGSYEWKVSPKRGTTYTLVAGTENPAQEGYFLTTTVHARIPEFESGTRTPWVEGTPNKGRVTFSTEGVEIRNQTGEWGTVTVGEARLTKGLRTKWVWGLNDEDGWISFPPTGINVYSGTSRNWGTVEAGKADLNELVTGRAQVKGLLTVQGGLTVSDDNREILDARGNGISVHGPSTFDSPVMFEDGVYIKMGEVNYVTMNEFVFHIVGANLSVGGTISMNTDDGHGGRKISTSALEPWSTD
jgi:hypothetical protein